MTSELRPAVVEQIDRDAAEDWKWVLYDREDYDPVKEMERNVAELAADFARHREAVRAEQAAELAKFKALAETLAGALHHRGGPLCPARYYGDAQCTCGVAEALLQYKEARDAKFGTHNVAD